MAKTYSSEEAVPNSRIFISYARTDGYDHAKTLREKLNTEGFEVWQDLIAMHIGENWYPQILKAIEQSKAVVLVLTPAALKSSMVQQEWVHARRVGTPIFPIAFSDIYKESGVPQWVKKVDACILSPDIVGSGDKWQTFLNQLLNPPSCNKVPNMVKHLPTEYVERQTFYDAILSSLLNANGIDPRHTDTASHIVTLLGEGGFGKTTLSEALGLDINVVEVFTGGVLFVTIGENATSLAEKWDSMRRALTGDETSVGDPIDQLKFKLRGDDFFVILDDVWDSTHIAPILNIPRCTYLITTRDDGVASLATDRTCRHHIIEMLPKEARDVLLNYIPSDKRPQSTDPLTNNLERFAGELGEWPLLLDIHGRAIREECQRGLSVAAALEYVREGLHEEGLDPFPKGQDIDTRHHTLKGSMNASLRRYADDEKQRLFELAIFPGDTPIPQATILLLWQNISDLSSFKAKHLLRRIAGHFCRFGVESDASSEPVLRFHDKIREYLLGQLADIPATHRALLDAYWKIQTGDGWHTLTDTNYIFDHLVYHLDQAGREAEIHGLFCSEGWANRRSAQSVIGLLNDFEHARQLPIPAGRQDIGIRYNFFKEVVDDLYKSVPVTAVFELLQQSLIPKEIIVSATESMEGDKRTKLQRFLEIIRISGLTVPQIEQCAEQIVSLMDASDIEVLEILRKFAPAYYELGQQQIWKKIFESSWEGDDFGHEEKEKLLDDLFKTSFSEQQYMKFKEDALKTYNIHNRIYMLKRIDPYLTYQEQEEIWGVILDEFISRYTGHINYYSRQTFSTLLPFLQAKHIEKITLSFWMEMIGAPFFRNPLRYIPKKFIPEVWQQRGKLLWNEEDRPPLIAAIAPHLPDELLPDLVDQLDKIDERLGPYRAIIEISLIQRNSHFSPHTRREKYLELVKRYLYLPDRFSTLSDLLPDELMFEMWNLILFISKQERERYHVHNLRSLAKKIPITHIEEASKLLIEAFIYDIARLNGPLDSSEISFLTTELLSRTSIEQQTILWEKILSLIVRFVRQQTDLSSDSPYEQGLYLLSDLNRFSQPLELRNRFWDIYISFVETISNKDRKNYHLVRNLEYYPEAKLTQVWLQAWEVWGYGGYPNTILSKLPLVYEAIAKDNLTFFNKIDWSLVIWDEIFQPWDRSPERWRGLARLLSHVSLHDAQNIFFKYKARFEEDGWEPHIGVALLPMLSFEQQYKMLSIKMMDYLKDGEDITYLISKWSGSLAFDVLRISLEKMAELRSDPNTRHRYEPFFYEDWLCSIAAGMPSQYVVDAWETVTKYDAWWYGSRDWYKVCIILIDRLDKCDERAIETIWNDIHRLEEMRPHSTSGFREAIAPKLPKHLLQSLIRQKPKGEITFSNEIFKRQLKEISLHKSALQRLFLKTIHRRGIRKLMEDVYRDSQTWWHNAVTR